MGCWWIAPDAMSGRRRSISNVGNYVPSACIPGAASSIKVYPPNQTTATYIPLRFGACSTKRTAFMDVWPIQAAAVP